MRSASQPSENCDGEMLTEILIAGSQSREASKAARMICSESRSITPISSAIGMKRSGGMIPASGWRQRARTSKPVISPVRKSTCGSKKGTNCSCSRPKRIPCSISPWAIKARSIAESNQIGRMVRPDLAWSSAMSARRSRSGTRISPTGGGAMPAKAPTWIIFPSISNGRVVTEAAPRPSFPQLRGHRRHRRLAMANSSPPVRAITAPSPAFSRIVPATAAKHRIAGVIAVPVVDRPEAMKLQGNDQDDVPSSTPSPKLVGAVREALSVQQSGDRIGRRCNRGAALAVEPAFGFMLEIHVSAPAEEDQRDVERQRDRGNLAPGPSMTSARLISRKKDVPLPISRTTAAMHGSEHDPVVPRTFQRRAAYPGRNQTH